MDATPPQPMLMLLLSFVTFAGEWRTVGAVSASASQIAAVRSTILRDYDRNLPPPGNYQIKVRINIGLLNVNLYAYSQVMEIEGLVYLAWRDLRLSWTRNEVVKIVYVYTDEIWSPDLGVLQRWDDDPNETSLAETKCSLSYLGYVKCVPLAKFRSHCVQDQTRWPYSQHNCSLRLASKLPLQRLKFELMEVHFAHGLASRNWGDAEIMSQTDELGGRSNVVVSFALKRRNLIQITAFVSPAFVLALLTVGTWFLPSSCEERLLLATFSVFLHCVVIDSLAYAMPENGPNPPQVALMYRDLLTVSCASFMAVVVLRKVSSLRALDTPVWLATLLESAPARFLLCSPHGSLRLQEEDDAEGLVSEEDPAASATATPPQHPAAHLALLMDRLGLLASATTCLAALSIRLMV